MTPILKQAIALLIGTSAGLLAYRVGMPLPWMLGPMIANTVVAVMHGPILAPIKLRPIVIPVIGVMLGSSITAEILQQLDEWTLTLVVMVPFLATAALGSYTIYRRIGKYDAVTAYFSSMPGGLAEMLLIGGANGGIERRIALAHASRVLLVVTFVGLFYGIVLGVQSGAAGAKAWVGLGALSIADWVWLGGCVVLGVPLGRLVRLPAPLMLGPMLVSAAAHLLHLVEVPPPSLLVIGAQIVLGSVIGCRFVGATAREVAQDLKLGMASSIVMLVVAVLFSVVTWQLTGTPLSQVFLAYSPGGLTEMSLLALALGQDVAYVSVMHILRILMVIVAAPFVFGRRGIKS